jgi:hypothetical protein
LPDPELKHFKRSISQFWLFLNCHAMPMQWLFKKISQKESRNENRAF